MEAGTDCPAYNVDVFYEQPPAADVFYEQPPAAACGGPAEEAEDAHEAVEAHEGDARDEAGHRAGRGAGHGAGPAPVRRETAAALAHVVSFSWSGDG